MVMSSKVSGGCQNVVDGVALQLTPNGSVSFCPRGCASVIEHGDGVRVTRPVNLLWHVEHGT